MKNNYRKNITSIFVICFVAMMFASCKGNAVKKTYGVIQDTKYDGVFLNLSIEDFIADGFQFGDSCDVRFSNGAVLEDIPFYNGYYVRRGMPLIVGYPGYKYVAVTCSSSGLWTKISLTENDTATVTLRKKGKYLAQQETFSQSYSNDRSAYKDDIQFANFRALSGGNLKKNFLYRGASPVDNQKNRAAVVNSLLEKNSIAFILNLADSEKEFTSYREEADFSSFYAAKLYDEGNVALLNMSADYTSYVYKKSLCTGLKKMIATDGPVYIHCTEGKDRTGFVCTLLEVLAGATYDEMLNDYMKTYENYYGISKSATPEKYQAIASLYFNEFLAYLHGTEDVKTLISADYTQDAAAYLLDAGMTADEIAVLKDIISSTSTSAN